MEYKGFTIEPVEGVQVGYKLPGSRSLKQQLGFNTKRKIKGYKLSGPDGGNFSVMPTIKAAKEYIDNYGGWSDLVELTSNPPVYGGYVGGDDGSV